jgi:hypothetical protein
VDCVRWFEVTEERSFYAGVNRFGAAFNRILAAEAQRYPNVEVVDYAAWADVARPAWFMPDNLHHTAPGQVGYAAVVRQAIDGCDPAASSGPFWDVANAAPGAGAIAWLGRNGVVPGYPNGTFRANLGTLRFAATRGELAAALWRRAGSPPSPRPARWTDVPRWLRAPLAWVSRLGLDPGFADGTFRPGAPATRAYAVRLAWRAVGAPPATRAIPWTDAPADVRVALGWVVASGHRDVFPGTRFSAGAALSRTGMARLLAPPNRPRPGPPPTQDAPSAPSPPPERIELAEPGD